MPGQIITLSNDETISEVSLKCGDAFFKDFPRNIYSQAVYRAERSIAKEFGIMDRVWTYTNTDGTSPITIAPLNFRGAWRVTITPADGTEKEYEEKTTDDVLDNGDSSTSTANYFYNIIYNANQYELFYTWPAEDDALTMYYTSSIAGEEDYEYFDSEGNANAIPVLPNTYFEETVRRGVRYMAQLGIASYSGEKAERFSRILRMYTMGRDNAMDHTLERDRPWVTIKAFSASYP